MDNSYYIVVNPLDKGAYCVNFDEIKTLEMPHTAKYMIRHYIDIGRYTNDIYGGVAIPGGVEFTKLESFE